jgi:hypothetical protein
MVCGEEDEEGEEVERLMGLDEVAEEDEEALQTA